jgi:hypothetical protein
LTPENEATILSMLEEIDTVGDGYFSERDVCQYFTGTIDFMCGEKDHYVPVTTTPPTNTEPKQAETFNDIWSLVLSLDDGELTKADLLNLIDYVMPNATREEINYEFNLHDIDHDGVVDSLNQNPCCVNNAYVGICSSDMSITKINYKHTFHVLHFPVQIIIKPGINL